MDEIYDALEDMDFTVEDQWGATSMLEDDDDEEGSVEGRHGFIRALIARRAESSGAALDVTLDRLAKSVAKGRIRPIDPARFKNQLNQLLVLATKVEGDRKLKALLKILRKLEPGTKVIVFTEYRATADYLHKRLDKELENAKIAKITGELDAAARRKVFRAFAPIAQRVTQLPRELYDLLVATDAISEGENLQDAEMVINYDLSWTPLRLIQRVGRINRFTEKTHKIDVRNFFPGTEPYEHIVKLRSRLRDRGQRVRELSDVDYLEDGVQTPVWLATQSAAAVAKLYEAKRRVLTWAELVETAREIPSTEVPAHLWRASPASRREARQLPDGVQGCGYGRHPGLYLLLDVNGRRIGLFRDDCAHVIQSAPQPQSHEELLALVLDVTPGEVEVDAPEFDRAIGELVQQWLDRPEGDQTSADVSVLAALEVREGPIRCSK